MGWHWTWKSNFSWFVCGLALKLKTYLFYFVYAFALNLEKIFLLFCIWVGTELVKVTSPVLYMGLQWTWKNTYSVLYMGWHWTGQSYRSCFVYGSSLNLKKLLLLYFTWVGTELEKIIIMFCICHRIELAKVTYSVLRGIYLEKVISSICSSIWIDNKP